MESSLFNKACCSRTSKILLVEYQKTILKETFIITYSSFFLMISFNVYYEVAVLTIICIYLVSNASELQIKDKLNVTTTVLFIVRIPRFSTFCRLTYWIPFLKKANLSFTLCIFRLNDNLL